MKKYFQEALEDVKEENKYMGIDSTYQVKAAVATEVITNKAKQKAQDEIIAKMSGSFDALASAAVGKAETINSHAAVIASLAKITAKLTETNKKLVIQPRLV